MAKRGYKLQEFKAHESDVNCLNVGKKSCRVFVTGGEDRKVNLWAIGRSTPLLSLTGHTSSVQSVTFDSAEILVLAGSSNGTIKLWDLEEAKIVRTHTGHKSDCSAVEFHPFGEFFASGSLDTDLKIWDIRKKGCIHTYKGHTRGIRTIKFTPDGRWVVTGGEDNVVKLWDLTAGKLLHDFKFHNGLIRCIDFHPHEFLLATGSADRTVKFWDLETFELIGSAGPETTGVRSMIFHPDGRTLLCGLDESLKVFSWEPIKCHDIVEMGWSTLGDLGIYEGKLLGCSYCQSHVRVWIVDISLVGPYAVGIMTKTNALSELVYIHGSNHSVDPTGSSPICSTGSLDIGSTTKEAIRSTCITSSECCQGFLQGIDYASNMNAMDLTGSRKNTVSCHSTPSKFDSRFSSNKSALNSNTLRAGKATESCPITPNRAKSSFLSRDISEESITFSANSSLTLNKGSIMDANTLNDIQPSSKSISVSVIVPRDHLDQETAGSCRKVTAATETTHDTILCKPNHLQQKPSFADGCYKSQLIGPVCEPLSGMANDITGAGSNFCSRLVVKGEIASTGEQNHSRIQNVAENFERIISLDQPVGLQNKNGAESPCSSSETSSVKFVKGVAVQLGRTRSLVESWERREKGSSSYPGTFISFSDQVPRAENLSSMPKGQVQTSERDGTSADDHVIPEILVQNHDVFINALKSRITKLQVVRHFWEHNGMRDAINAVAKLPDHSVQVDVIGILKEKIDLFTLDLFSCSLPLLAGLLNSKIERHVALCLELLLDLGKIFGPVIFTTKSASLLVGVNLQAEQRLEHCNQCFKHLRTIKQMLPSLIRRGGLVAKHAQELTLLLHDL